MIWDLCLSSQVSKNQMVGGIWTDLRKLFTITFQLQTGLDDLDNWTAAETGPQPFVLNVLMPDCSEGSINGWHWLGVPWECTPVTCTTCASTGLDGRSPDADESKGFVDVSKTSWNENKAPSSDCTSSERQGHRTVRNRKGCLAVLGNILVSESLTGWDHLGLFSFFFTLQGSSTTPVPYGRTAGSAVVTRLLVSPSRTSGSSGSW